MTSLVERIKRLAGGRKGALGGQSAEVKGQSEAEMPYAQRRRERAAEVIDPAVDAEMQRRIAQTTEQNRQQAAVAAPMQSDFFERGKELDVMENNDLGRVAREEGLAAAGKQVYDWQQWAAQNRAATAAARKAEQDRFAGADVSENPHAAGLEKRNQEFMDALAKYVQKPMTQEELDRRERGVHARAGIGALGNVASAFANLIGVARGAENQKLPEAATAAKPVADLRTRQQALYDRYMEGLRQGYAQELQKYNAYETQRKNLNDLWHKDNQREDAAENKQGVLEERKRHNQATEKTQARNAATGEYRAETGRIQAETAQQRANTYDKSTDYRIYNGGGGSGREEVSSPYGGSIDLSKAQLNEVNLAQVAALIDDSVLAKAGITKQYGVTKTEQLRMLTGKQLRVLIGNNLRNRDVDAALRNLSAGRAIDDAWGYSRQGELQGRSTSPLAGNEANKKNGNSNIVNW